MNNKFNKSSSTTTTNTIDRPIRIAAPEERVIGLVDQARQRAQQYLADNNADFDNFLQNNNNANINADAAPTPTGFNDPVNVVLVQNEMRAIENSLLNIRPNAQQNAQRFISLELAEENLDTNTSTSNTALSQIEYNNQPNSSLENIQRQFDNHQVILNQNATVLDTIASTLDQNRSELNSVLPEINTAEQHIHNAEITNNFLMAFYSWFQTPSYGWFIAGLLGLLSTAASIWGPDFIVRWGRIIMTNFGFGNVLNTGSTPLPSAPINPDQIITRIRLRPSIFAGGLWSGFLECVKFFLTRR